MVDRPDTTPPGRPGGSVAIVAGIPGAVFMALALFDQLSWWLALVAWGLTAAALALALRRSRDDLLAVSRYLERLRHAPDAARPPVQAAAIADDLAHAAERLVGDFRRERERTGRRIARTDSILERLPGPLVLLGRDRTVLKANAAARAMFGEELVGHDLALSLRHPAVLAAVGAVLDGEADAEEAEISLPVPVARDFRLGVVALSAGDDDADEPVAMLAFQDLTAMKRAEQLRADFVANASHELRTPLATLLGFIETLQGPARDDAAARERFLAIMHEQANRMARLIRDLLSLSRIEMNEHTPPAGTVDLPRLAQSVADMLRPQSEAKRMRIEIAAPPSLPPVTGDQDELTQVFQNLMDNAIKYGRAESAVRIEFRFLDGGRPQVAATVRDQGEGIPREHLPRLTERFYRVDSARSRQLGGTGLGLAIVKHIVNRHRGRLGIESVAGEGSAFTVTLPAADNDEN